MNPQRSGALEKLIRDEEDVSTTSKGKGVDKGKEKV